MDSTNSDARPQTRASSSRNKKHEDAPLPKPKFSSKDYSRMHREAIKADERRYKAFCAAEKARMRKQRQKWTEEQKQRHRDLQRERQRKYRERKQQQQQKSPVKRAPLKKKGLTKEDRERKRESNRVSAQKMRDNYSDEKRTVVNDKRLQRYWNKRSYKIQVHRLFAPAKGKS